MGKWRRIAIIESKHSSAENTSEKAFIALQMLMIISTNWEQLTGVHKKYSEVLLTVQIETDENGNVLVTETV